MRDPPVPEVGFFTFFVDAMFDLRATVSQILRVGALRSEGAVRGGPV
jgi:hypothetical protein